MFSLITERVQQFRVGESRRDSIDSNSRWSMFKSGGLRNSYNEREVEGVDGTDDSVFAGNVGA
jgi:hypothetical protein